MKGLETKVVSWDPYQEKPPKNQFCRCYIFVSLISNNLFLFLVSLNITKENQFNSFYAQVNVLIFLASQFFQC